MSKLYRSISMLYKRGLITPEGLKQSVVDGNITEAEYKKICGQDYVA